MAILLGDDEIRTVLATFHCSLLAVIKGADFNAQITSIRLACEGAAALRDDNPHVVVTGQNSHAEEGGLLA